MDPAASVILFDGPCVLCNAMVRWVARRDSRGRFRFAPLQSEAARRVLEEAASDLRDTRQIASLLSNQLRDDAESMVVVDGTGVHLRSDAAIQIARTLGFPWSLASAATLIPRPVRDAVYNTIARSRYRWFGRRDGCAVPGPELASRLLDGD